LRNDAAAQARTRDQCEIDAASRRADAHRNGGIELVLDFSAGSKEHGHR
jgi:hypothetical protein